MFLPNGIPLQPGDTLTMPNLALTMKTLAEHGSDALYGGSLGEQLAADLVAGGSRIELDDLASYRVHQTESLQSEHRQVNIHTAGETSGGPRLI